MCSVPRLLLLGVGSSIKRAGDEAYKNVLRNILGDIAPLPSLEEYDEEFQLEEQQNPGAVRQSDDPFMVQQPDATL